MTTASMTSAAPVATPARLRRAGATIGVHGIVDFFSFVIIALMPLFAVRLDMTNSQKALLIGIGSITSGLIQPLVAWLSDRHDTRVLGTIGMAVAVVCVCAFGLVETFWQLFFVQAVSAAGIGAFHPIAAASVGQLAGRRRSHFLAVFFLAGMIGGVAGNALTPVLVDRMSIAAGEPGAPDVAAGLRSLFWLLIPGMIGVGVLAWAIHSVSHRSTDADATNATLSPTQRALRWRAVWILYAANVIRFIVNMALVYLVVEWATLMAVARAPAGAAPEAVGLVAAQLNGPLQGAQQVGMGLGGIALGMLLPVRHEKRAFCLVPWIGAVAIAAFPLAGRLPAELIMPAAFAATVLAGVGFGSLVPVSIALAQRLLPHRTSLASGLMMGGAWTIAFLGPLFAGIIQTRFGLDEAFYATGALLCLSGLLAVFLPKDLLGPSR